ncbi:PEP-CTERM domain protein [Bradyrhizobium sp. Tv2a-2]|uniref:PEP-CTERM domain protein n=1 Tax=Bradyrhizobium sp. Tv2a-2 TaxID=113395 RepID=UPI0003FD6073|nr:PEP-CTERM domain protein [Bradyrhizobium sp. Tv2a-2]
MTSWKCIVPLLGAALPLIITPAKAAVVETFDWSLTGPSASSGGIPDPASGTLVATEGTDGAWTVISVSGTVTEKAGTFAITGPISFFLSDNIIYPAGTTTLSTGGFAFQASNGEQFDIFSFYGQGSTPSGNAYGEFTSADGFGVGTFTLTAAVPEASTWVMMILGFAGLGVMAYRRGSQLSFAG